jgi:hypothetical protein
MQFFACFSPFSSGLETEEKEIFSFDVLEVQNFIIRKKFSCQSLSDLELVKLFAWYKLRPSLDGPGIAHDVSILIGTQKRGRVNPVRSRLPKGTVG